MEPAPFTENSDPLVENTGAKHDSLALGGACTSGCPAGFRHGFRRSFRGVRARGAAGLRGASAGDLEPMLVGNHTQLAEAALYGVMKKR